MEVLSEKATAGAPVVTDDLSAYEHLYPFLRGQHSLSLVETHDYLPPWEPRLEAIATQATGELWLYAPLDSPLHAWLSERYRALASHQSDSWLLSGWDTR
jgi:hypothetical protein